MNKYTAEVLEDTLSLLKLTLFFCAITYLVFWQNFNPAWYLLLLLVSGYILNEDYIARKKLERELED